MGRQAGRHAASWNFLGFGAHLEPLSPTDALDLLPTHRPTFFCQHSTDAPIAIARIGPGQHHNALVQLLLPIGHGFRRIPIRRSGHGPIATRPAHRAHPLANHMGDGRFFLRRAHHFFELTSLSTRFSNIASANIFFNSTFSFSSSFSRLASANSMSPYFFFQR